jgi:hypothetical protein
MGEVPEFRIGGEDGVLVADGEPKGSVGSSSGTLSHLSVFEAELEVVEGGSAGEGFSDDDSQLLHL